MGPRRLEEGWRHAATAAGAAADPGALPDLPWAPVAVPGPVPNAPDPGSADADAHARDHWWRLDAALPGGSVVEFQGLATVAEIWLDGSPAARSATMYRPVTVAIPPGGAARIDVCCRALRPLLAGRGPGPSPRWRGRLATAEGLRRWRTTLLGHMPGWSPPDAVIGPYRPVLLHPGPPLRPVLRSRLEADGTGVLTLRLDAGAGAGELRAAGHAAPLRAEGDAWVAELHLPDAPAWWPHTHGTPELVAVTAELAGGTLELGRTGFRRIARRPGPGFALAVNDVPVFCRGALIAGPFTADAVARAAAAGLNMLRVPGYALYPPPEFLDACDAAGILVWQDFQFARFDYPRDAAFLAEARAEAEHVLAATARHPSLAVLCGGAEVAQAAAMAGRPLADWTAPLFEEVLAGAAAALRPDVPYVPHAPLGADAAALPFAAAAPVAHYFGLGGYLRPPEDLASAGVRFAAACLAFAQLPDAAATRALGVAPGNDARWKALVPRDLGASWDFEDVRDHYVAHLFGVAPDRLRREAPERWLALGRAATAWLVEEAFAHWRSDGVCAGALVLMLQDLAPGSFWGLVSADGRPKSAWHALRRTCRPVQVLLRNCAQNGVRVHLINETATPRRVRLTLRGLAADGGVEVLTEAEHDLPARSATMRPAQALMGRWRDLGHGWGFGPAAFGLLGATLTDAADGALVAESQVFPAGLSHAVQPRGLAATLAGGPGDWRLRIAAREAALFVQIDDDGFLPEDDHLHLWPGEAREVALRPASPAATRPAGTVTALNALDAAHYRADP